MSSNGAPPDTSDPVGKAVSRGYRVIEEHVRRGEAAAREFQTGAAFSSVADPEQLASRIVQYGSDLMGACMQFFEIAARNLNPPTKAPGREPGPFADVYDEEESSPENARPSISEVAPSPVENAQAALATASQPAHALTSLPKRIVEAPRIGIILEACQKAIVRLDMPHRAASDRLIVHALRASDASKPRIRSTRFEPSAGNELLLRIAIPEGQPPGVYNGMIVDEETSLPAGTVSVRVEA